VRLTVHHAGASPAAGPIAGAPTDEADRREALHQPGLASNGTTLLLRPRDAACALAIIERKLWELTNLNLIPCVRIGRAVRYSPLDLQAWIEVQKRNEPLNAVDSQA
jgi:hypothetical protein